MIFANSALESVEEFAHPLTGHRRDLDPFIEMVGDARFVLLGEASHGTREFYELRAQLTRRLIAEKGFNLVCWEADFPDTLRAHRYINGHPASRDANAEEALSGFVRFPAWMWRNHEVADLVEWLHKHNHTPRARKVGLFGLDVYSLHASMRAVVDYLEKHDPAAAAEARKRYACFEEFGEDPQSYGMIAGLQQLGSCEEEVVQQLVELQKRTTAGLFTDGPMAADEAFFAEQNARVAKNAEEYYRAMYRGRPNTWNLRDTHMADTLDELCAHFGEGSKAIVWAHNSHLGDARATQMGERGELNLGQLMRERHAGEVVNLGFTTFTGEVFAADEWDGVGHVKKVRPGLRSSCESLFHDTGLASFLLNMRDHEELRTELAKPMLQRAIGVIYRPDTERYSHYFDTQLSKQFDAVIHINLTHPVNPLDADSVPNYDELPETYPSGV